MADEYTVESALTELREMFPSPFTFTICVFIQDSVEHWTLSSPRTAFIKGDSIGDCMAQVKQWRESQKES
jgi:hypothetical protein